MQAFDLQDLYGCTRQEFCERTGTRIEDMQIRLQKEITILEVNLAVQREQYRSGGNITEEAQRRRAKLINTIEAKIKRKAEKVKDIQNYLKVSK